LNITSFSLHSGEQLGGWGERGCGSSDIEGKKSEGSRAQASLAMAFRFGNGHTKTGKIQIFFLAELLDKCFNKNWSMMQGGCIERGEKERLLTR
jgi:hypothetical protein